jgi:hypothetical protein
MGIWVRAVCKKSLSAVTPELLVEAVSGRLPPLVTRYKPAEDEPLREVLLKLRVEREDEHPFGVWRLHYDSAQRFIRLDRAVGRDLEQDRRELFDEMTGRESEEADRIRALLSQAKEDVRIELSASESSGMALPLAVAAAAALSRAGEGLVRIDGEGWLEAKGKDVALVLAEGAGR